MIRASREVGLHSRKASCGCSRRVWLWDWSVILRLVCICVFRLAGDRHQDWTYKFSASVLEIYNEQIYDLLAGGRDQDADKLDVKQVKEQGMVWGKNKRCERTCRVCL